MNLESHFSQKQMRNYFLQKIINIAEFCFSEHVFAMMRLNFLNFFLLSVQSLWGTVDPQADIGKILFFSLDSKIENHSYLAKPLKDKGFIHFVFFFLKNLSIALYFCKNLKFPPKSKLLCFSL